MSAAEVRDDGRSLRQSLDAKSTQDGGRPLRGSEFGLGQPAGFAIGPTLSTNSYSQVGNSDAKLPRVHSSHAEREPHLQARGQSMYGLDPGVRVPADREPPPARARSPSPPSQEHDRPVPMERPRYKEPEKVEVPAYPEITKLMTWKTSLARAVMIAANNPQAKQVMQWVSASWAEGQTYEALGDDEHNPFVTLDMKLAQGMMIMLNKAGEKASRIRDKVNLKTEEATRNNTLVTGRQLVFMLL